MILAPLYRLYQFTFYFAEYFLGIKEPKIVSGPGTLLNIPNLLKENKLNKPLIVTDQGINSLGLLNPLFETLNNEKIEYG